MQAVPQDYGGFWKSLAWSANPGRASFYFRQENWAKIQDGFNLVPGVPSRDGAVYMLPLPEVRRVSESVRPAIAVGTGDVPPTSDYRRHTLST